MSPTVSVVIPCYNLGEYLDEAVDSVFAQTFTDFEIVIVDDGSTDERTRTLLANYNRPGTRVVRTDNRGLPAAKNMGAAQTVGKYLCMLDADDRLDPSYMARSVAALDQDETLAFASHWLRTFGEEEKDWTPAACDFPALLDLNTVNGAALVRREALNAAGGFDESMREGCEDWDFWISLVARGFRGRIIPEVLFHYRRRPGSMSRTMMMGDGHARLYGYLARKHRDVFRLHLPALMARREHDESRLRLQIDALGLEHFEWTQPELEKRRDDLAVAERRAARHSAALEREALASQAVRLQTALDTATSEALRYHADANRASGQIHELHRSLSWRLTQPLRSISGWIRRVTGGRS
jgi:glycosyltransferase involved in cell wall biosynthesis